MFGRRCPHSQWSVSSGIRTSVLFFWRLASKPVISSIFKLGFKSLFMFLIICIYVFPFISPARYGGGSGRICGGHRRPGRAPALQHAAAASASAAAGTRRRARAPVMWRQARCRAWASAVRGHAAASTSRVFVSHLRNDVFCFSPLYSPH